MKEHFTFMEPGNPVCLTRLFTILKVPLCLLGVVAVGGEEELSTIMTLMPQKKCTRHFVLAVYSITLVHFELHFAFCYLLCTR